MISSTVATLECAAQVSAAAISDAQQRIAGDGAEQRAHRRRVLGRRERVEQDMQREQHQAEPDRHPAEVLDPRARAAAEGDEADDEQHRRAAGDVERQQLHDQRRADIGAEHDRKRRNERRPCLRR